MTYEKISKILRFGPVIVYLWNWFRVIEVNVLKTVSIRRN